METDTEVRKTVIQTEPSEERLHVEGCSGRERKAMRSDTEGLAFTALGLSPKGKKKPLKV